MAKTSDNLGRLILVLNDIEETRDGILELLKGDGYRVDSARSEQEAVAKGRRRNPDLILVSGLGVYLVEIACRVREQAKLSQSVPVVIFCVETIAEGAEIEIERNVYATRPDNFDQLRALIQRLLNQPAKIG